MFQSRRLKRIRQTEREKRLGRFDSSHIPTHDMSVLSTRTILIVALVYSANAVSDRRLVIRVPSIVTQLKLFHPETGGISSSTDFAKLISTAARIRSYKCGLQVQRFTQSEHSIALRNAFQGSVAHLTRIGSSRTPFNAIRSPKSNSSIEPRSVKYFLTLSTSSLTLDTCSPSTSSVMIDADAIEIAQPRPVKRISFTCV